MSKQRPLKDLKDDPKNPREIIQAAADGLARSMKEFGDVATIVWNEKTGELVAGHQRMKQLRDAGAKDWTQESDDRGYIEDPRTKERFAIRIVSWPISKQRLANIVANNPELQGDFTDDVARQLKGLVDDELKEALMLDVL